MTEKSQVSPAKFYAESTLLFYINHLIDCLTEP